MLKGYLRSAGMAGGRPESKPDGSTHAPGKARAASRRGDMHSASKGQSDVTTDLLCKLFLAHSTVRHAVNATLKQAEYKWKYEHFAFLAAIPAQEGISRKYIASVLFGGDLSAMRRILADLGKAGLIRFEREADDRRHLRVHITAKGLKLLATLDTLARDSIRAALSRNELEFAAGAQPALFQTH